MKSLLILLMLAGCERPTSSGFTNAQVEALAKALNGKPICYTTIVTQDRFCLQYIGVDK